MSIADGDDEDLLGIEHIQLEQAPSSISLEDHLLQVARRDPGAVHRAAQRHEVHGEFPVLPHGFPCSAQHMIHDVRDYWRNPSYNCLAVRYQQERFEHAVQEHQRAA